MNIWGGALQAVGGLLQPPKCTQTAHDMVQDKKGKWVYRDTPKTKEKGDKEADEEEEDNRVDDLEMTPPN